MTVAEQDRIARAVTAIAVFAMPIAIALIVPLFLVRPKQRRGRSWRAAFLLILAGIIAFCAGVFVDLAVLG